MYERSVFVMGISEYNIGEAGTGALALCATWNYSADVVNTCIHTYIHTFIEACIHTCKDMHMCMHVCI